MTPSGIEPPTFRFLAQYLNHCATISGPLTFKGVEIILVLGKIFGPVQNEDGSWRIRLNYELNKLIQNAAVVRFIKSRRTAWLGHVMLDG
jgi:hypothetical protein